LRHFGVRVPDFRSSELWHDRAETDLVTTPEPLDLLLFNRTCDPWGAHVAVYLGEDRAIHLSKEVGLPAIWTLEEFARRPAYRVLVGAKRVRPGCG
jgi:cell wall-associated NlpC family hydrolase